MGNKASRWLRNYDAERRALKLLSRRGEPHAEPHPAPRYAAEQQALRQMAADPVLEASVKEKNSGLLSRLAHVKVVSSSPASAGAAKSDRPLPQRRHFVPMGDLGVADTPAESVPTGRLSLAQFQELLNTREPVGGRLPSSVAEELLAFYAPLVQRSRGELHQMLGRHSTEATVASTVEAKVGADVPVTKQPERKN